jgi:hypothetical protein
VLAAKRKGIRTFTVQHGIENVGLSYFDDVHGDNVRFGSDVVFTWSDGVLVDSRMSEDTRRKCVPVGCPKDLVPNSPSRDFPLFERDYIAVFENLHWHRYSKEFVDQFYFDFVQVLDAYPNFHFVVKPHHAGRWLTSRFKGPVPIRHNLLVIDPSDPKWEPFTAGAFIQHARAVITTPSTVAFDAARMKKAVAVAGYDLALPAFDPLPVLRTTEDWCDFLRGKGGGAETAQTLTAFVARHAVAEGPQAVARILDFIATDGGREQQVGRICTDRNGSPRICR